MLYEITFRYTNSCVIQIADFITLILIFLTKQATKEVYWSHCLCFPDFKSLHLIEKCSFIQPLISLYGPFLKQLY